MTLNPNARHGAEARYAPGTKLRHHAGSTWRVCFEHVDGDYTIQCVVGTVRPGFIGGDSADTIRRVHADYLHGNGWKLESQFDTPSARATPAGFIG